MTIFEILLLTQEAVTLIATHAVLIIIKDPVSRIKHFAIHYLVK